MENVFQIQDILPASASMDDPLEKGFQLAYFILPDRAIALQILRSALRKLKAQRSREKKRIYWRDKYMKRKITRTVRDDSDALQWLIYCESTHYEKEQEQIGQQSTRDMVVRYIKHLAQLTTSMSSFYVNVGLQRLLRNYDTSDTQRAYECLTEHYPGSEEYRRIKSVLMKQLTARFSSMLRIRRMSHGELRFEAFAAQEEWADCVNDSLELFTPWSTRQLCSRVADLGPGDGPLSMQLFAGDRHGIHRDVLEAFHSHMFIDPFCHGWLNERLGLDSPRQRLAVPRFYFGAEHGDNDQVRGSQVKTAKLTQEEKKEILDQLAEEALERQQVTATFLVVVINGAECARIDLRARGSQCCEIEESSKLIEIWMEGEGKRVLLATHWIEYTEWNGIAAAKAVVALGGGGKLLLELVPARRTDQNEGGASVLFTCRRGSRLGAWMEPLQDLTRILGLPKLAFAFMLLAAIAGILGTVKYHRQADRQQAVVESLRNQLAQEKAEHASPSHLPDKKQDSASLIAYRLTPDDLIVRGGGGMMEPVVSVPSGADLFLLKLPASRQGTLYHATLRSFLENREVLSENSLRSDMRGGDGVVTLAVPASLVESKKHYVITLNAIGSPGRTDRVRTFTFYVVRK